MKKIYLFLVQTLMVLSLVFAAGCDDSYVNSIDDPNFVVIPGEIKLSLKSSAYVSFYIAGDGGTVTIDWGDGIIQTYTLFKNPQNYYTTNEKYMFTHASRSNSSITITGNNITHFSCDKNPFTSLDVSKNPALKYLSCNHNQLTNLDVSKNTALTDLICIYNQLKSLDVSKNTALTQLRCSGNSLTSLDMSKNVALIILICNDNRLTSLDMSKNVALGRLDCNTNQLSNLDMSNNIALGFLNCIRNNLPHSGLNALFETLHSNERRSKSLFIRWNPGSATCDRSIATNKGWEVDSV